MTNHWNQNRSSFRTGEPADHFKAKDFIGTVGRIETGSTCKYEYPLCDPLELGYQHNYDIVLFGNMWIIEIDDANLHSKPKHVENDKRAENIAMKHFPKATFLRLDKDELNNQDHDDLHEYMDKNFWPYMK